MKTKQKLVLILILLAGFFFRTLNLNWDQNQHLHPDERFLTMVGQKIELPQTLKEYFDPRLSPLNPYNQDYDFFVYGTLPLNLVKLTAVAFKMTDYNHFVLVGRWLSALLETGVLVFVFLITREVLKKDKEKNKIALWAMFFYAISVLPIQLAHFFASETFLVFFSISALYFLFRFLNDKKTNYVYPFLMGLFAGLALASKITALSVVGIIFLGLAIKLLSQKRFSQLIITVYIFLFTAYLFLRIGDPRLFVSANFLNLQLNPQYLANLAQLKGFNDPQSLFPPGIQWIKTTPIIFPLRNLLLWGLGLPLGLLSLGAIIWQTVQLVKKRASLSLWLILIYIGGIFLYQGVQFSKNMRYFYPLYPFLAILSGLFFQKIIWKKIKSPSWRLLICFSFLIYPLSFLSIYTHSHSRVAASRWIYENIPAGSVLAGEHWDDWLPLSIDNHVSNIYPGEQLSLFSRDTEAKWQEINQILEKTDYLILSSNRLWGSIPTVPEIYPQTSQYYQKLFKEKLGFKKVAEFTSYPCFPPIGKTWFCFPDQSAEENFTVFDHPQVIIFEKAPRIE